MKKLVAIFLAILVLMQLFTFISNVKATSEAECMVIPPSYSQKYDSDGDGYLDSHKVQIDADTDHDTGSGSLTVHAKGRMYDRYDNTPLTSELQVDWQIRAPGHINQEEYSPEMHFNVPKGYTSKEGLPYIRTKTLIYLYDNEWHLEQNGDYEYAPWEIRHNLYPPTNPPQPYDVTVNAHCDFEGIDISVSIKMDGAPTSYSTPHTFTDLTGPHDFTVPDTDVKGHPFAKWSTGQTDTTIRLSSAETVTAYYKGNMDFEISVNPSFSTVEQGHSTTATVTTTPIDEYPYVISLSSSGEPPGVAIAFDPSRRTCKYTSTMTVQVESYVREDTYPITITGTGEDSKVHSTSYTLTVGTSVVAGEITDVRFPSRDPNPAYSRGEIVEIWVDVYNPTSTELHYLAVVNIFDPSMGDPIYDSHKVGADRDALVPGYSPAYLGPFLYIIPTDAPIGTYHVLAGLRLYPWDPELDYRGLSWCPPEETFAVESPSNPKETIVYFELNSFDNSGDGYHDAAQIRVDADTTDGTLTITLKGYLKNPDGATVDSDSKSWQIIGTGDEYNGFNLYVPNGDKVGKYTIQLELYDNSGNFEDSSSGTLDPLYPPDYKPPNPKETIAYWELNPFDDSGDGKNDAVQLRLDVDTTDGTLVVIAYSSLYDPNGDLADIADSSWTITGTDVEYGELYLYVPNSRLEGNYHIVVEVHDTQGNHEDDTDGWAYLYPPDYNPKETIAYFELNPFDNSGDGYDDAARVRLNVDTTDGTLTVTAYGYLYNPSGNLVDSDSSTWTITGTNIEYGELHLYAPNGGVKGKYHITVEVYDNHGNHEDDAEGWLDPLYPPDYKPSADEYFAYFELNSFDSNGDGYHDAVQIRVDADTTDGTLSVALMGYLKNPDGVTVDSDSKSWQITGTGDEYDGFNLYVPNGGKVGKYTIQLELYDEFGNYEDSSSGWVDPLYPPDYNPHECIYYFELNSFDNSGDGRDDAAHIRLDVNTEDGTLVVIAFGYLYDPNGDLVDIESSSWTITGINEEYGEFRLYIPNGGLVGKYHVVVEVHDTLGNHEDDAEGWLDPLYPPDYNPKETIAYFELNPFDSNGDGYDDAVHVGLDVDTEDGTLDVTAYGYLYDPNGNLVDSNSSTWPITGSNFEYGSFNLYIPSGGPEGKYRIYVEVYDNRGKLEDDTEGWLYYIPPPSSLTIYTRYPDGNLIPTNELSSLVIYWDSDYSIIEPVSSNPYTFNDLLIDDYLVKAYVNDMYSGDTGWIYIGPGSSESRTMYAPAQGYLRVQAQYNDGAPLPNAYVEIESHDGTVWKSGYAESDGWTIWFCLQPTTQSGEFYKARVYYNGYQRGESVEIRFGLYESKEISLLTNVPRDNAWMHVFDTPSGILHPGDWTTTKVEIENTGTTTRSFWILVSYQRPDGIWYDLDSQQTIVLSPSQKETKSFDWQIPLDAPFGLYNARATVWHGYDSVNKVMIPPKFDHWDKTVVFTVEAIVINGEIADIEITKKAFKLGESIPFNVKVKNTGNVNHTFWISVLLLSPKGFPHVSYSMPPASIYVAKSETLTQPISWIVPDDASAGFYSVFVDLLDKKPSDPTAKILDSDSRLLSFMVDRGVSFLQIERISSLTGEQYAIQIHIVKEDVVKSGILTFKIVVSMLQLAKLATGHWGSSLWEKLAQGVNLVVTLGGIEKRAVELREDGSADLLILQFIGEVGFLYEASLWDIGSIVWPVTITPIPKEYLESPSPYFSELQFDWTTISYIPAMEKYFPYWKFSKNEQWYPTTFYFDNNTDVSDNKKNYEDARAKGENPPYYVYIHVVEDANYLTIQYWMYYVYNKYGGLSTWFGLEPHMQDWDSRVYVIFDRDNLETPIKVGFISHFWSYTCDWEDIDIEYRLEKVDTHVVAYVAEGSHGVYHFRSAIFWDAFELGGITLGYENLTNWVIVGKEIKERNLPGLGEYCLLDYYSRGLAHPTPLGAIVDGEKYWPKSFDPRVKAAWHQDDTWSETIPPMLSLLAVIVHSPVNLLVEDSMGRYVGTDENGVIRLEIPDAIYTGSDSEPEVILINNPSGEYKVYVYGVGDGTFDLDVTNYSGDTASVISNITDVSIYRGQMINYAFLYPVSFDVTFDNVPYEVVIFSNSTVDGFNFNKSSRQINFDVSGVDGTIGFCNVTIPKNLIASLWNNNYTITIDGNPLSPDSLIIDDFSNATHTFLYFTYPHTTHEVVIIPEFSSTAVLLLFILMALVGLLLSKIKWKTQRRTGPFPETMLGISSNSKA